MQGVLGCFAAPGLQKVRPVVWQDAGFTRTSSHCSLRFRENENARMPSCPGTTSSSLPAQTVHSSTYLAAQLTRPIFGSIIVGGMASRGLRSIAAFTTHARMTAVGGCYAYGGSEIEMRPLIHRYLSFRHGTARVRTQQHLGSNGRGVSAACPLWPRCCCVYGACGRQSGQSSQNRHERSETNTVRA